MFDVRLAHPVDFDGWRRAARALRIADVAPAQVRWSVGEGDLSLFDGAVPPEPPAGAGFTAPRALIDLAREVICHADPERFDRLYRLLWRAKTTPELVHLTTDADVAQALAMRKTVRQAEHKMHAFVRFRRVDDGGDAGGARDGDLERYFAWYEPPHYVIALGIDFFVRRLANVAFTLASPYVTATWDGAALSFSPGGAPDGLPAQDDSEEDWKAYFIHIFNPARLNPKVMTQQMAKAYWKNLPEAQAIPAMIAAAQGRTEAMVEAPPTLPSERARRAAGRGEVAAPASEGLVEASEAPPSSLEAVAAGVQACRRCELWRDATQGVPGQGPRTAALMFVGEQPGDMEDLRGAPFVGPAGQLFDKALAQAAVPRADTYVTNAVKHFKHELRGKRRIHAKPGAGEVRACRWWLDGERAIVRPRVIVALGATASTAVFGRSVSVLKNRGLVEDVDGARGFLTVHPSFLLRLPDEQERMREFDLFVRDLAAAYALTR